MHIPRRAWQLLPVAALLVLCLLLRWSMEAPEQETAGLALAILAALPWSLFLTVLDHTAGWADRAAWLVVAGIALNTWLVWTVAGWLWELRPGSDRSAP